MKLTKPAIALTLVLGAGSLAQPADAKLMSRITTMNWVNVRTGPSTGAKIIGHLNLGDHVWVRRHVGTWDEIITPQGRDAYVDHNFLTTKLPLQSRAHHYRPGKFEHLVTAQKQSKFVWMDFNTHLYHSSAYGGGKHGGYMPLQQAIKEGGRPDPRYGR